MTSGGESRLERIYETVSQDARGSYDALGCVLTMKGGRCVLGEADPLARWLRRSRSGQGQPSVIRSIYTLVRQPTGETYQMLIDALAANAAEAVLVVRDDLGLSRKAERLLQDLLGRGGRSERASRWPGTELSDSDAELVRVPPDQDVVRILRKSVSGLYEWLQPDWPEDLCFLRADGSTVLGTISHESDAFLELSVDEYESLVRSVPGLSEFLVRAPS